MSYTRLVSANAGSANENDVTTSAIDTTGAKLIVIAVAHQAASAVTPTDSKGNTWTLRSNHKSTDVGVYFYECVNPTVGTGHTFTLAFTSSFPGIGVAAYSSTGTPQFDKETGATQTSGTSLATGSITPAANDQVVLALVSTYNVLITGTASSPFSSNNFINLNTGDHTYGIDLAEDNQTTATARNCTWTLSGSSQAASAIATWGEAGAGGGGFIERHFPRGILRGVTRGIA